MTDDKARRETIRRQGYARRARQISEELRHDADRLEKPYLVTAQVFDRIDACLNAYAGGGYDSNLTAAVRFMWWVDEGLRLERKSLAGRARSDVPAAFDGAKYAARGFTSEYPERAMDLQPEDWRTALDACAAIGKRGKAKPWARLAQILGEMGLSTDGENLKKACGGLRNTPGHVLGTMRWGNRSS
jgi:hypothetical protein